MKVLLVKLAQKYFSLSLPVSERELKSAYRRESFRLHPDRNGKASEPAFKKMLAAYQVLILPSNSKHVLTSEPKTEEGILLSELGLGEGPSCQTCLGRGYTEIRVEGRFLKCELCGGTGAAVMCPDCGGTGKNRSLFLRVTPCKPCHGQGYIAIKIVTGSYTRVPRCPACHGAGGNRLKKSYLGKYKCKTCDGQGVTQPS